MNILSSIYTFTIVAVIFYILAGSGGPGTIYLAQDGDNGVLEIDNRGKDPKIAKNDLCNEFDVETSGLLEKL